jgi:hypothetical protein
MPDQLLLMVWENLIWILLLEKNTVNSVPADQWHFGADPDPRIRTFDLTDPAPDPGQIFVSDLQDANKKVFMHIPF